MTWFPEDASKTGFLIDHLFYLAFGLTAVTFVIVLALLLYFLVRYRGKKGQKAYYTKGDSPKAVLLTLILALTVFIVLDINLAVHDHLAWEKIWSKPDPSKALEIRVKPEQFVWNAEYAGEHNYRNHH
jgi:cytochrome c oxidase subunit 2